MKHHAGDTYSCPSGMDNSRRIRKLLREIRDARGREIRDAEGTELEQLWPELEHLVAMEMGRLGDDELALKD